MTQPDSLDEVLERLKLNGHYKSWSAKDEAKATIRQQLLDLVEDEPNYDKDGTWILAEARNNLRAELRQAIIRWSK